MSTHRDLKKDSFTPVGQTFGGAADQSKYRETVSDKCIACLVGIAATVFRVDQWNMDNVPAKHTDEPTQKGMG